MCPRICFALNNNSDTQTLDFDDLKIVKNTYKMTRTLKKKT
jgi:hypothetical protein